MQSDTKEILEDKIQENRSLRNNPFIETNEQYNSDLPLILYNHSNSDQTMDSQQEKITMQTTILDVQNRAVKLQKSFDRIEDLLIQQEKNSKQTLNKIFDILILQQKNTKQILDILILQQKNTKQILQILALKSSKASSKNQLYPSLPPLKSNQGYLLSNQIAQNNYVYQQMPNIIPKQETHSFPNQPQRTQQDQIKKDLQMGDRMFPRQKLRQNKKKI